MSQYHENYNESKVITQIYEEFFGCKNAFHIDHHFQPQPDGSGKLGLVYDCFCLEEFLKNLSSMYHYFGSARAHREESTFSEGNTKCWRKMKSIIKCRLYVSVGVNRSSRCIQYYVDPNGESLYDQAALFEPYENVIDTNN